jgi:hypothetical protein
MATVGIFTNSENGYAGSVRTLTVNAKARFTPGQGGEGQRSRLPRLRRHRRDWHRLEQDQKRAASTSRSSSTIRASRLRSTPARVRPRATRRASRSSGLAETATKLERYPSRPRYMAGRPPLCFLWRCRVIGRPTRLGRRRASRSNDFATHMMRCYAWPIYGKRRIGRARSRAGALLRARPSRALSRRPTLSARTGRWWRPPCSLLVIHSRWRSHEPSGDSRRCPVSPRAPPVAASGSRGSAGPMGIDPLGRQ